MPVLLLWAEKDPALGQQARPGPRCLPLAALAAARRRRLAWPPPTCSFLRFPPRPTQLIAGTERYCDSLRVEVLQGCSHWAQQDQPAKVNALWREFLAA